MTYFILLKKIILKSKTARIQGYLARIHAA